MKVQRSLVLCGVASSLASVLLIGASAAAQPAPAPSASRYPFQYAAKVLCTANIPGTSQTTPSLLPGVYQTVVNVHNPNGQTAKLRKKIALLSGEISTFVAGSLKPDQATAVDCEEVARGFGITPIHGVEGFLVVESALSLDVTAVYTAGKRGGEVESIDVEAVRERRLR
jgi:hypothetical protein